MMTTRNFGRLGQVSALTLGGGGIGGVWGTTDRAEAVATVHAALDGGITMLDLAPSYGTDQEAEQVAGVALRERPAPDLLITTKVGLHDDEDGDLTERATRSLHASLERLGRDHIDLFLLHSQLRPSGSPVKFTLDEQRYQDEVRPLFESWRDQGTIRAWGLTGVGHPQTIMDALTDEIRPDAVQVVVNALDQTGDLWPFGSAVEPRNTDIRKTANQAGVLVIAIRALAAGSLGSGLDRPMDPGHTTAVDFARAEPFRKLAAELGQAPALLAHRYALSVPGVSTVVLGVKNRAELTECLEAEARGPLTDAETQAVDGLRVP
jgi:aryl-alcohol dehydrogenase-like predicted oxidoreductase